MCRPTLKMSIAQILYEYRCLLEYDPVYPGRNERRFGEHCAFSFYLDDTVRRHSRQCLKCDKFCRCFYKISEYFVLANCQNRLFAVLVTVSLSVHYIIILRKCVLYVSRLNISLYTGKWNLVSTAVLHPCNQPAAYSC